VLLSRGARRVYAVDVGRGQLHSRLRSDPRVTALEQTDIRALSPDSLPELPDFIVIDVSFISLTLALPPTLRLARAPARLIALIKPQFEAGRCAIRKGIVRDPAVHRAVCARIATFIAAHEWQVAGVVASPLPGGSGNREFLLGAQRG
jgi:23S rRNA (cytidine1920-2'-O)/16S rRNA (cytidine1409-2'-O)-methyltransferase